MKGGLVLFFMPQVNNNDCSNLYSNKYGKKIMSFIQYYFGEGLIVYINDYRALLLTLRNLQSI